MVFDAKLDVYDDMLW